MTGALYRYFFYSILLFFPTKVFCQPSLHYIEKLTTDHGLSSNRVSDVVQDRQGFLWIGTSYGLNRYDGMEVTHYFVGAGEHSIADNIINRLVPLDSFHIAIATHHGISILDTRHKTFHNIYFHLANLPDKRVDSIWEPYENMITLLAKDKQGNLWVATPISLYRLDTRLQLQKVFHSRYTVTDLDRKRLIYVYKILPLFSGNVLLWLNSGEYIWLVHHQGAGDTLVPISQWNPGSMGFLMGLNLSHCFQVYDHYLVYLKSDTDSLFLYNEQTGRKVSCSFPYNDREHINWQQRISALGKGWLALSFQRKGMALLHIGDNGRSLSLRFFPKIYFPNYTFRKIIADSEGNWWATTEEDGLLKISLSKQLFNEKLLTNSHTGKVSAFEVASFYRLGNRLFIASYGDGIYEWRLTDGKLNHYLIHGATGTGGVNAIWNFHLYRDDTLWIGTQKGLYWYDMHIHHFGRLSQPHPTALDSFAITTQFTDSHGLVWMGLGKGHGVCTYNPFTKRFEVYPNQTSAYPFRYPIAIAEDSASNLWFLSDNVTDLVRWNRQTKQFKIIPIQLGTGLVDKPTGAFYLDGHGLIWYGVESIGLVCYDTHHGKIKIYGRENGLNTGLINSIKEDRSGRLWIATNQGLSCFDPRLQRFVNYSPEDGLPAGQYSSLLYYDTLTNTMYAGMQGKIIYFSPKRFSNGETPMRVQLTRLQVNNRVVAIDSGRRMTIPWHNNNITVFFTGINLTDGMENRYAYRLGNNPWIDIGAQRQIHFASLSPGHYHFMIRAARKGQNWSPITDYLELNIQPPFTGTIWFYLILVGIICGLIYIWYRYRLMQLMKIEKMRSRISHDLHDEIGSHLTNISLMSLIAQRQLHKKENLIHLLKRIYEDSQKVSQNMREIVWNVNPDNDDLDRALPRMLHYATEMLEAKDIIVNASIPELSGVKMNMEKRHDLFLIFKEAINNIACHSGAKNASISIKLKNKLFRLQVADDGKGFDLQKLPYQNGLHYMTERAALRHWNFAIHSTPGKGTFISLNILLE